MYNISFGELKDLKTFLAVNTVDFVDVFCYEDGVKFVSNTSELFACLTSNATRTREQGDLVFRLPVKLLNSIGEDSILQVSETVEDGVESVRIDFRHRTGDLNYSSLVTKQVVFDTMYVDKLELVNNFKSEVYVDTESLVPLIKIAKMFNSFVNVDSGVACVMLQSGPRIYKKVDTSQVFAVMGDSLAALQKCNKKINNVKGCLLARNGDLCIIATKVNPYSNEEYKFLSSKQYGAKCIAEVNFGKLMMFFSKTHLKIDSVFVNVENACVNVEAFNSKYTIPVNFDVIQIADGAVADSFYVPASVVFGFFNSLDEYNFILKQKKSFIQIEQGDYSIIW